MNNKDNANEIEELIKNNQSAAENNEDHDEQEYDDEESDYITRDEFEYVMDDISVKLYLHQLHLDEMQKRIEETPQQLSCDTRPEKTKKTCVTHYNLGLAPLYVIEFEQGHKSDKPVTLCIYVQRLGGSKALHYKGEIVDFPKYLDQKAMVLISSSKDKNGRISFECMGIVEDRSPNILSIIQKQQSRISALEQQVTRLTITLEQNNANHK